MEKIDHIDDSEYLKPYTRENLGLTERGGPGSGFKGHAGRPGEVGGSAPSGKHQPRFSVGQDVGVMIRPGIVYEQVGDDVRMVPEPARKIKAVVLWISPDGLRYKVQLSNYTTRIVNALQVVERHMGPGDHPSGSPQDVHAGGRGRVGKYTRTERYGGKWKNLTDFGSFGAVKAAIDDLNDLETFERLYVFFNEEQAYRIDGDATSVSMMGDDELDIILAGRRGIDVALLHNHPEGGPFSPQDIEFLVKMDAEEMWVISDEADYIMRIDPSLTYDAWSEDGIIPPRSMFLFLMGSRLSRLDKELKGASEKEMLKAQIQAGTDVWKEMAGMWPRFFQMEVRHKQ